MFGAFPRKIRMYLRNIIQKNNKQNNILKIFEKNFTMEKLNKY